MRTSTALRAMTILALAIGVASAHHPFSAHYDETKPATLTGTVAAVQWSNPHVVFALDVQSADGTTQRWMIEGYPPMVLKRNGWDRDSLRKGSRITISGWLPRDATLKIFSGHEVTFEDGSTRVFGAAPGPGAGWKCATPGCPAESWVPSITQ